MRFVVIGDMHSPLINTSSTDEVGVDKRTGPPTQPRDFEDRFALLLGAIEREIALGVAFVILNGDIIHSTVEEKSDALKNVNDAIEGLGVSVYASAGNHDRATDADWVSAFGHSRTHAFEAGNCGFLIIQSSNESGSRRVCLDEEFVEDQFALYSNKDAVFVFSHIPRYGGIRPGSSYDSPECTRILGTFETQQNLVGVFHSHFHEEDRVFVREGVSYCFTGHVAHYGLNYYGYRVVEVINPSTIITKQKDVYGTVRSSFALRGDVPPEPPEPLEHTIFARVNGTVFPVQDVYAKQGSSVVEVESRAAKTTE